MHVLSGYALTFTGFSTGCEWIENAENASAMMIMLMIFAFFIINTFVVNDLVCSR
jgi:hypothetical protein